MCPNQGVQGALPFFNSPYPEREYPYPLQQEKTSWRGKLIVSILVMTLVIVAVLMIMRVITARLNSG